MKSMSLICVGKLKDSGHLNLEADYLKRLQQPNLIIHETRAHDDQRDIEAKAIIKKIQDIEGPNSRHTVIALTERGKLQNTLEFHGWLQALIEEGKSPLFIIGGASGHGQEVLDRSDQEISLSPLTFPHKLARLLLIEQLYRAQTLRQGHPYHK